MFLCSNWKLKMSLEIQNSPEPSFHDSILEMESPGSSYEEECSCETCNNTEGSDLEEDDDENKEECNFTQIKNLAHEKAKAEEIIQMTSSQQLLSSSLSQSGLDTLVFNPARNNSHRKYRQCSFCKIHGFAISVKGHKSYCRFREGCMCKGCNLIRCNQEISKNQVRLRRQKDMEAELLPVATSTMEPSSQDADPVKRIPMCFKCWVHDSVRVRLKGHRNVCPYARCGCANCSLNSDRKRFSRELRELVSNDSDKIKQQRKSNTVILPHLDNPLNNFCNGKQCVWHNTTAPSYNATTSLRQIGAMASTPHALSFTMQAPVNLSQGVHQQEVPKWANSEMMPSASTYTFSAIARTGNGSMLNSNIQHGYASSSSTNNGGVGFEGLSSCQIPGWFQVPNSVKPVSLQTSLDMPFLSPVTLDIVRDSRNNTRSAGSFQHYSTLQGQPQIQTQVKDRVQNEQYVLLSKAADEETSGLSDLCYRSVASSLMHSVNSDIAVRATSVTGLPTSLL
ncbi:uncharacterized protein LOC112574729 isoform X2 [Pomacea canaliculata]|uniref:uncharacterized protein LOC112574729 isoform X2 n=1 Tax=Pomacea canaliculata TaxID=400727 RepID=UPI000D73CE33|nr:uncharacterized protein LOC112574729 isoform X2 [Pomacea canaliculata]